MTVTPIGSIGTINNKVSSSTLVLTTTADAFAGDLVVVATAWDNNNASTISGPDDDRYTPTDSVGGNTWVFIAGGEDSGANARCASGMAYCVLTNNLPAGSTITFTYVSARTAKAATAHRFTLTGGGVRLYRRRGLHTRAADPDSLTLNFSEISDRPVLLLHSLAGEGPNTDSYTWDSDYTQMSGDGTTGSTDDTNMHIRAGYRIASGLSTDTVDVTSDTADRDYTQMYAVLWECQPDPGLTRPADSAGFSAPVLVGVGGRESDPGSLSSIVVKMDGCPKGSFLLVAASCQNNNGSTTTGPTDGTITCADSAGNSWTNEVGAQDAGGGVNNRNHAELMSSQLTVAIPPGGTITVTNSASSRGRWNVTVWRIMPAQDVSRVDRQFLHTAAADPGSLQPASLATTVKTNPAPTLTFHVLAANGDDDDTFTWDSDYTLLGGGGNVAAPGANTTRKQRCSYKIGTSTESVQLPVLDVTGGATNYTQLLATFITHITHGTVVMRGS